MKIVVIIITFSDNLNENKTKVVSRANKSNIKILNNNYLDIKNNLKIQIHIVNQNNKCL